MKLENYKITLNQKWNMSRIFKLMMMVILLKKHRLSVDLVGFTMSFSNIMDFSLLVMVI